MKMTLAHVDARAEAFLSDRSLINVSEVARAAGFRIPVAVTAAVWESCLRAPESAPEGRLWEALWMLLLKIGASGGQTNEIRFSIYFAEDQDIEPAKLNAIYGKDAQGPTLTVMLSDEN